MNPAHLFLRPRYCAGLLIAFALAFSSAAADPIEGGWTWEQRSPNGGRNEPVATFKREGDTLTGNVKTGDRESKIIDGKITDANEVSFRVERVRNGFRFAATYKGKFDGKRIVGETEMDFNGDVSKRKWVAERHKEPTGPHGNWRWTFKRPEANSIDYHARFREEEGIVTGRIVGPNGAEIPIQDGVFANEVFSFKIVRERDGRKFTSTYSGKVDKDKIVGQVQTDWSGDLKTYDWTSARIKR